jgi:hypothetical protein
MEQLMMISVPYPGYQLIQHMGCWEISQESVVGRGASQCSVAGIGALGAEVHAAMSTLCSLLGQSLAAEERRQ